MSRDWFTDRSVPLIQRYAQFDLVNYFLYLKREPKIHQARSRYLKLYRQVLHIVNTLYAEQDGVATVIRLRREIRLATRGTPVTAAQESVTAAGYVSMGTEALYNSESFLVKIAYRKVAPLVHPDRGGSAELFASVNAAYRLNDLTYLQELFLKLVVDCPLWRASKEAQSYIDQEIKRPDVSLRILQTTPEFKIAKLFLSGHEEEAKAKASLRLKELIVVLNAELQYLLTNSFSNEKKESNNEDRKEVEEEHEGKEVRS